MGNLQVVLGELFWILLEASRDRRLVDLTIARFTAFSQDFTMISLGVESTMDHVSQLIVSLP